MAERLEQLAAAADPGVSITVGSDVRVAHWRQQIDQAPDLPTWVRMYARLGNELLSAGRTDEALAELIGLREALARAGARLGERTSRGLGTLMATAYLRQGEQDNCLARHGPDSCLMPIQGSGVHVDPAGSTGAIKELVALLEADPDDLASRWLLNLAHMTLGSYPDGVPEAWLVPPSLFGAQAAIERFPNVASRAGVDVKGLSGGVVIDDIDRDGRLDIVASAWGLRDPLRYFHNDGDGRFSDRSDAAGLTGEVGGLNLLHADYDNDGYVDLLVLRGGWLQEQGKLPNSLLRNNGDGTFDDVTEQAGLLSFHPTQTAAWLDYDNDGWLDLFIGNESVGEARHPCEMHRNNGDGTFSEVAASVGLDHVGFVKAVAAGDYDDDGRVDLYLSRMEQANILFRNDGPNGEGWRFTDVTARAGVAEPFNSFPAWFFDFDNDGMLDLFVAPFPGFSGDSLGEVVADYIDRSSSIDRARLYRNAGDGTFDDVSKAAGIDDVMLAMGANFGDLDNDGLLDVYIGTGEPNLRTLVPNRMYRNAGDGTFENATFAGGFGHLQKGHGIAFADLDNDGDQDVYAVMGGAYVGDVAYNAMFLNPGSPGARWIALELEGVDSNRSAIGARIRVTVRESGASRRIHSTVGTGGSFGSSSLRQEIGLGAAERIEEIRVRWPSGKAEVFTGVDPDRAYRLTEGSGRAEPIRLPRVEF